MFATNNTNLTENNMKLPDITKEYTVNVPENIADELNASKTMTRRCNMYRVIMASVNIGMLMDGGIRYDAKKLSVACRNPWTNDPLPIAIVEAICVRLMRAGIFARIDDENYKVIYSKDATQPVELRERYRAGWFEMVARDYIDGVRSVGGNR